MGSLVAFAALLRNQSTQTTCNELSLIDWLICAPQSMLSLLFTSYILFYYQYCLAKGQTRLMAFSPQIEPAFVASISDQKVCLVIWYPVDLVAKRLKRSPFTLSSQVIWEVLERCDCARDWARVCALDLFAHEQSRALSSDTIAGRSQWPRVICFWLLPRIV